MVGRVLESFCEVTQETLAQGPGTRIRLPGLGTLLLEAVPPRRRHDVNLRAFVWSMPAVRLVFLPAQRLREGLQERLGVHCCAQRANKPSNGSR